MAAGLVNPYCIADGGKLIGLGGTSAATPGNIIHYYYILISLVVAGMVAQLNDLRLAKGKSSLGFLNPFIYANSQCFMVKLDKYFDNVYLYFK